MIDSHVSVRILPKRVTKTELEQAVLATKLANQLLNNAKVRAARESLVERMMTDMVVYGFTTVDPAEIESVIEEAINGKTDE